MVAGAGAQWPTDNEPFGLMGCRFFRYRGYWEVIQDTLDQEESTEAVCVTVAMASVLNYHRWPLQSYFDGAYRDGAAGCFAVPIAHRWRYDLINGPKRAGGNCEDDDPGLRTLPWRQDWTGLDEIRKLIYVVERSFGHDQEFFRSKTSSCDGLGDYAIDHMMRNRFGYPEATSVSVRNSACMKLAIRNITDGVPVIALKCEHAFVLDGYRKDPASGKPVFHVADYVNGEETTGWFSWKMLLEEGMAGIIANLNPSYTLPSRTQRRIAYWWGDDFVPCTSNSTRRGLVRISRAAKASLGDLEIRVTLEQHDPCCVEDQRTIFTHRGPLTGSELRIPAKGSFELRISSRTAVSVVIRNNEAHAKKLRVMFHDFEGSHDIESCEGRGVLTAK